MNVKDIPVLIPTYEPDVRLIELLRCFKREGVEHVILVNDGSNETYNAIFEQAKKILDEIDGVLLVHSKNEGKGKALKTGFEYLLNTNKNIVGVITADSDGQHSVKSIQAVQKALLEYPQNLILGVRKFDSETIPWKSRFGNLATEKVFKYLTGTHISDTQTGLRGIPKEIMKTLLNIKSNRFEFEMEMLLQCIGRYEITEIPIDTIYDSNKNHQTHFRPLIDSFKIYKILVKRFIKYVLSSMSSCLVDLLLFSVMCYILKEKTPLYYVFISTIVARIISAIYNYFCNYKIVFESSEAITKSATKYFSLAIIQMLVSAFFTNSIAITFPKINETVIKAFVDTFLFLINYYVQNKYIFKKKK